MNKFSLTMILFIGLNLPFYVYSQDSIMKKEYEAKRSEKIEKPNAIFFAPLNLFDFVNPNFQIGYERFVTKKWAFQIESGMIINHSIGNYLIDRINNINVRECPYTNKGFRVRGSIKYVVLEKKIITLHDLYTSFMRTVFWMYRNPRRISDASMFFENLPRRNMQLYVSPELFYFRNKSGISRSFLISDPDFEYSFAIPDWAGGYTQFFYNDEEKMGLNFKVGTKIFYGKHFFIEYHLGIGFAYRNVVHTGRENPDDELYGSDIFDNAAPNKWVPTIPFNFKVGLRF